MLILVLGQRFFPRENKQTKNSYIDVRDLKVLVTVTRARVTTLQSAAKLYRSVLVQAHLHLHILGFLSLPQGQMRTKVHHAQHRCEMLSS